MTLLLLVIAAVSMTGMSRRSMARALSAVSATEELQRRWAVQSCRQTLLPVVLTILDEQSRTAPRALSRATLQINLSGQKLTIVLSDEQAKVNVHVLHAREGLIRAEEAVRRLKIDRNGDLPVRLRPARTASLAKPAHRGPPVRALSTWNQVFVELGPTWFMEKRDGHTTQDEVLPRLVGAVSHLTLWGDGRLSYRRVSKTALEQFCSPWLGASDTDRFISLIDASPGLSLEQALDQLQLTDQRREKLASLLTVESNCQSLWIIAGGGDRPHVDYSVRETIGPLTHHYRFIW